MCDQPISATSESFKVNEFSYTLELTTSCLIITCVHDKTKRLFRGEYSGLAIASGLELPPQKIVEIITGTLQKEDAPAKVEFPKPTQLTQSDSNIAIHIHLELPFLGMLLCRFPYLCLYLTEISRYKKWYIGITRTISV